VFFDTKILHHIFSFYFQKITRYIFLFFFSHHQVDGEAKNKKKMSSRFAFSNTPHPNPPQLRILFWFWVSLAAWYLYIGRNAWLVISFVNGPLPTGPSYLEGRQGLPRYNAFSEMRVREAKTGSGEVKVIKNEGKWS
jgi:hypothetical protein